MFGTIRRHQQLIWVPIVIVTIVGFVWFFMPNGSGYSRAIPNQAVLINGKPATINGHPITRDEFNAAYRETYLGHFFRSGGKEFPDDTQATKDSLEHDAVIRVF